MRLIKIGILAASFCPVLALAAGKTLKDLITSLIGSIINPLLAVVFALALVIFLWGVLKFIQSADDSKKRDEAKNNILWGLIALVVMVSVYSLVNVLLATFSGDFEMTTSPTVKEY